jgi:hypothetical protein
MIDLGCKLNMGWTERIIYRELNDEIEDTSYIGAVFWAKDIPLPFKKIFPFWPGSAAGRRIFAQII